MASKYWIKLYIEVLDDPKMGMLPADLWRFTVELFLLAGEINCNGTLQNVTQISWRLRYSVTQVETWLKQLEKIGVVTETADGWTVTNFEARQAASDVNERVKRHRERQKELKVKRNVTDVTVTPVTNVKRSNAPDIDIDIDIDKSEKKKKDAHTPNDFLSEHKTFGVKLTQICGYSGPEFVVNGKLDDLAGAVNQLVEWNATPDQLDQFKRWWWGKTPPTFKQVVSEWGKFLAEQSGATQREPTTAPPLDDAKRAAYAAMLAADREAAAESAARVGEIMAAPTAGGVDVERALRRVAKGMKK